MIIYEELMSHNYSYNTKQLRFATQWFNIIHVCTKQV